MAENAQRFRLRASAPALPLVAVARADQLALLALLVPVVLPVLVDVLVAVVEQLAPLARVLLVLQQLALLVLQVPVALVAVLLAHPALLVHSLVVAEAAAVVPATAWISRRATQWSAAAAASTPMLSTSILPRILRRMWAKIASFWNR